MNRETILEILRTIITAFVIASVINIFRLLIFDEIQFSNPFSRNQSRIQNTQNEVNNFETREENITNNAEVNSDIFDTVNIPIEPMKSLSGLSKNEIFNLRREAVNTSPIFSNINYNPSTNVFGQIGDNLPWISAEAALHWSSISTDKKSEGVSRDSIGILNPELLYYVSISEYGEGSMWIPFYKPSPFEPYKVVYKPEIKTIIAYIKNERNKNGNYEPITLADSNAHDLGYKYAYMDSYDNVGFYNRDNYNNNSLHLDIKEVTGWYMHGSACGIPGGCNNYAPYWQYYNTFYLENLPATVHIKLWKNKPARIEQEADINYELIFE